MISYVVPKNKTMAHRMSLNNRISCVVGISILVLKTYWKRVFDVMEIQTTQTFEQFLQAKTLNAKNNNSYYQGYNVKRLRAFHKQVMMKQQIYKNMPARRSWMDYSPGIKFQTSLINMEEAKELTMNNQPGGKAKKVVPVWLHQALTSYFKVFPFGTCTYENKKSALGMALSKSEAKKAAEYATSEEERKCLAVEAAGEGGKLDEGASA